MGCRLRVHVWGARSGRTLGTLRLCARGSLGAHSWGSRSGCSPGLRARAANSRCSWGAGWGCALRVCAWAANSGRELEVLLGCRVRARRRGGGGGVSPSGCEPGLRAQSASSRCSWGCSLGGARSGCELGGALGGALREAGRGGGGGAPLLGGPCAPRVAVSPRKVVCFRKWLLHVAVVTGTSGSARARLRRSARRRAGKGGQGAPGLNFWGGDTTTTTTSCPERGCGVTSLAGAVPRRGHG